MAVIASGGADDPRFEKREYLGSPSSGEAKKAQKAGGSTGGASTGGVDPAFLAFLYLVEAASASAQSAVVRAKELNGNAVAQEKLNREASALSFKPVPKSQIHVSRKSYTGPTYWTHGYWWNFWVPIPHHKHWVVTHKYVVNQKTIEADESANQNMYAMRTYFEDKLTVLQQSASISQTAISTQTQSSMQSMQEGSNILDIIQTLTFKALLTQPPSN